MAHSWATTGVGRISGVPTHLHRATSVWSVTHPHSTAGNSSRYWVYRLSDRLLYKQVLGRSRVDEHSALQHSVQMALGSKNQSSVQESRADDISGQRSGRLQTPSHPHCRVGSDGDWSSDSHSNLHGPHHNVYIQYSFISPLSSFILLLVITVSVDSIWRLPAWWSALL